MSKCIDCFYYNKVGGVHKCYVNNNVLSQTTFEDDKPCACFSAKISPQKKRKGKNTADKKGKSTEDKVEEITSAMCSLLHYKNKNYGDIALNSVKVFSAIKPESSICIRLDDKLARVRNGEKGSFKKNDLCDLIGYLTLLCIEEGVTAEDIEKMKD